MSPKSTVVASVYQIEIRRFFFICASRPTNVGNDQVDYLDTDERSDDAADAVYEQVPTQQRGGAERPITHSAQSQRHERDDDERVENDRGKNRGLRRLQPHDVQH